MSWSIGFEGNAEEVKGIFNRQREQSAGYGMIEAELADIDAVRDLVANFADRCGRVVGTASGHWINAYAGAATPPQLGQVSVSISLAKDQGVEP